MKITDPVSDLFTRIRNIALAGKTQVTVPYSSLKENIVKVLKEEGYLSEVQKVQNELVLTLAVSHRKPIMTGIRSVSKPGLRIYRQADKLPKPLRGAGVSVVSTPEGIMSGKKAQEKRLGGEVLGEIW